MARILLAWELGANLGHIAPLRALAQQLRARGHSCVFAARDLNAAEEFIEPELGPVLQAPVRLSNNRNPVRTQVSYASLLNNSGFDDIVGLSARIRAWRHLLHSVDPQLLICDHAPTALVAARSLGLPRVHIGTGFTVPPLTQPFPVFRPDLQVEAKILAHNESAVLQNLNQALARQQLAPFDRLQDLFEGATGYVLSYPELDHYECPRAEPYHGVPEGAHGAQPAWPPGEGPKILAYLRPFNNFQATLTALARTPARVLLRVGDVSAARLKSFLRPGLVITDRPVNMQQAAQSCDAFVNYASHGVTAEMLLAGKPGLLLPTLVERNLVTVRAQRLGAALTPPAGGDFNLSEALRQLTEDHALRRAAETFAARYAHQDRGQILPRLTDEILARFKL